MQLTVRNLRDLAKRNLCGRRPNLRLAVAERGDDRGGDYLSSDDLSVTSLASVAAAVHDDDLDGRALWSPGTVVQVEKIAARALIKDGRATQGEGTVAASREARSVDGASLGWLVELELVVCRDVSSAGLSIFENTVLKGSNQNAIGSTIVALLFGPVSHIPWPQWLPICNGAYARPWAARQSKGKQS